MEQAGRATERKTGTKTATHTELGRIFLLKHQGTMFSRGRYHRYQDGVWEPVHDFIIGREIWRHLMGHEVRGIRPTRSMKSSVLDYVQREMYVEEEYLDANESLINLENGTYDLETQTLSPHDSTHYITTQLPFAYDPNAQAITWQMYLMSTFVKPRSVDFDKELAEFVQEAVGYSLTTSICHHVMFWCYGEGANGKGVLFHILKCLGGTACVPLNVGMLKREYYQLAALAGKRIALCTEASATDNLVEDAYVKALVAGDPMPARQIYKQGFELEPRVKLWWSMNELPAVADTSEGFWRRLRVIPFNRHFCEGERILDLNERLEAELPGIFNWAMDGLRRLRDRGRFVEPKQIREATRQYRKDANPVALFIDEECQPYEVAKVQSSVIYGAYKDWCKTNNYKPHSAKNFKHEMERLGFRHQHDTDCNRFYGVELFTSISGQDD